MADAERALRSIAVAFDEGDDLDVLRSAYDLAADAIAFELEDHVPRAKLAVARKNVRRVLEERGREKPTFVRLNGPDDPEILSDLEAVVCPELHAVLLPKIAHPNEIVVVDRLLSYFEARAGMPRGTILVTPILESASGHRLAYEIAIASPRCAYVGAACNRNGDPAISIGYEWTREMRETVYLRQKTLLDARAASIAWPVNHGVWNALEDLEGLESYCVESRQIGYRGMLAAPIPEHLAIINRVFTPAQDEIDYWAEIVPIVDAAGTDVVVDGQLIVLNKAKWGRLRLDLARRLGVEPSPGRRRLKAEAVGSMAVQARKLVAQRRAR